MPFSLGGICTDGVKAMVGKTAGVLVRMKAVSSSSTVLVIIVFFTSMHLRGGQGAGGEPVLLKNVLEKLVKMISFTIS